MSNPGNLEPMQGQGSQPFQLDIFANAVEQAANERLYMDAGVQGTPDTWAIKGKPAVTSLLAAGYLAITDIGQCSLKTGGGGNLRLNQAVSTSRISLSSFIKLSPLYDYKHFIAGTCSPFYQNQLVSERNVMPKKYQDVDGINMLTEPKLAAHFSEYGFGLLERKTGDSLSRVGADYMAGIAQNIVDHMKMNESADSEISSGLETVRRAGLYTPEAYFDGVLNLAQLTSRAVIRFQETKAAHNKSRSGLRGLFGRR